MHRPAPLASLLSVTCLLIGLHSHATAAEPVDLSGKWHGIWVSCTTGHHGKLNARFCKIDDCSYKVRFTGTFFGAIPFAFSVKLNASPQADGTVVLSGDPRLPLFGTFHFSAIATEHDFNATYSTDRDEGQFHLSR
jgi:hypothetical protein